MLVKVTIRGVFDAGPIDDYPRCKTKKDVLDYLRKEADAVTLIEWMGSGNPTIELDVYRLPLNIPMKDKGNV